MIDCTGVGGWKKMKGPYKLGLTLSLSLVAGSMGFFILSTFAFFLTIITKCWRCSSVVDHLPSHVQGPGFKL